MSNNIIILSQKKLPKSNLINFVFILFLIFTFEGFYLPLLYSLGFSKVVIAGLLYSKYLLIILIVVLGILSKGTTAILIKNFEISLILSVFIISISISLALANFNKFTPDLITLQLFPLLSYWAGRYIVLSDIKINKLIKFIVITSCLVSAYAILDICLFSELFWQLGLQQGKFLMDIKNYDTNAIINGLIGNFFMIHIICVLEGLSALKEIH